MGGRARGYNTWKYVTTVRANGMDNDDTCYQSTSIEYFYL